MTFSRRSFVHRASFAALAGAAVPFSFAQAGAETLGISRKSFEALVGQRFSVLDGETAAGSITLMAVEDLTPGKRSDSRRFMVGGWTPDSSHERPIDCFALRFEGLGAELTQKTYTLRSGRTGSVPMFLTPAIAGEMPARYTAIFSLLGTEPAA